MERPSGVKVVERMTPPDAAILRVRSPVDASTTQTVPSAHLPTTIFPDGSKWAASSPSRSRTTMVTPMRPR